MSEWKNDRAEGEMKKHGEEMMEQARLKKEKEEALKPKELGKFEVKLISSTEHTPEDIQKFKDKLLTFETICNAELPMLRVHVNEIVEDGKE